MSETKYPEHEKLRAVHDQTLLLSEFYDWLGEQGCYIGKYHKHDEGCTVVERKLRCIKGYHTVKGRPDDLSYHDESCWYDDVSHPCGLRESELYTHDVPRPAGLFGLFFDIDPKKLSAEKDAMVKDMRAAAR